MEQEVKDERTDIQKICKNCGKPFYKSWTKSGNGDFCSKLCSKRFANRSGEECVKEKIRKSVYNSNSECSNCKKVLDKKKKEYYENPKKCVICGKPIPFELRNRRKSCSQVCSSKLRSESTKGNASGKKGGYREGGGRSRSGYYNDIFMGSTYELVYYIYQTEHGKEVKRNEQVFPYKFNGKRHTYLPDFIVDGKYVEIKGLYKDVVEAKLQAVRNAGFEINILYQKDLEEMMQYVDSKYGTKHTPKNNNYYVLYQDYKPKFEYVCDTCGKHFFRDDRRKTITGKRYCCRKCSDVRKRK